MLPAPHMPTIKQPKTSGFEVTARTSGRGFSIAELVTVLAIMVLLAAIAAPRFAGANARNGLVAGSDRIVHLYQQAVLEARSRSSSVQVSCDTSADTLTVRMKDGDTIVLDLGADPYRIDLSRYDFEGAGGVTIDAWGDADVGSTFLLERGAEQRIVHIGAEGVTPEAADKGDGLFDVLGGLLGL